MFKKIKKHFNKILIACLTLISSIAIFSSINKTYAYETDSFTYTIDMTSSANSLTETTLNGVHGYLYNNSNTAYIYTTDYYNENSYLLINFYMVDINNNFIHSSAQINFNANSYADIVGYVQTIYGYRVRFLESGMSTFISKFNYYGGSFSSKQFTLRLTNLSSIYQLLITNIDVVSSTDIGLSQYYETYYGQIEDNYNQLLSDYNDLQDNYDTLQTNYDTLEDNYNDLQEQYESTSQENLENQLYNQYGDLYKSSLYIDYRLNGVLTRYSLTFDEMLSNNIISNSYLYFDRALQHFNLDTSPSAGTAVVYLSFFKPINVSNVSWVYRDDNISGASFDMEFNDSNLETFTVGFATEAASPINIDTDFLLTKQIGSNYDINNLTFNDFQLRLNYAVTNPLWISINTNYANSYNNGYNYGYQTAYNEQLQSFQPVVSNLRQQIASLNEQVTSQQLLINSLQETISANENGVTLNSLIWTIAGTPFESFKQIWNVDFLGVNISGLLTGFFTALIVLFIVKKFFL